MQQSLMGQPGRMLDVSRAEKEFGFRAKVGFEEGLKRNGIIAEIAGNDHE